MLFGNQFIEDFGRRFLNDRKRVGEDLLVTV
jgi:hypothetical protein